MVSQAEEITEIKQGPDSLQALAKECEESVRSILQNPPRLLFLLKTDVPELRKQLLIILTRLSEVRRLLHQREQVAPLKDSEIEFFRNALSVQVESYKDALDSATDYADMLERVLIMIGGPVHVQTLLINEAHRDDARAELHWSMFLPRQELNDLLKAYDGRSVGFNDPELTRAVDRLIFLSGKRGHVHHRHARARLQLQDVFLKRLALILTVLIFSLCLTVYWNAGKAQLLAGLMCASAGALGSVLAGVLKVRDEINRIGELRLFGNVMVVQPLVGASAGLLLFMVLTAGLPGIGSVALQNTSWATVVIYALVAGFSEPYFLGVVQRVANAGDRKADGSNAKKNNVN